MITYKICKELKEAGFPFKEKGNSEAVTFFHENGEMPTLVQNSGFIQGKCWCVPTLAELIEDCGERFYSLRAVHDEKGWCADSMDMLRDLSKFAVSSDKSIVLGHHYGKSPEEAVARLWLELNKNVNNAGTKSITGDGTDTDTMGKEVQNKD